MVPPPPERWAKHALNAFLRILPNGPGFSRIPALLALGVCLFLLCLTCSCSRPGSEDTTEARERAAPEENVVPVKVVRPSRGDIVQSIQATTSIEAKREADVYSKMTGFCDRIFVEEGDAVREGDRLAKLDDEEIRLTFEQAAARLDKAKNDYERAVELHAGGLISDQAFQDLSVQFRLAKSDYDLSRKRLDDTAIMAPLSGVVTDRDVKLSDLVSTTQPLFRIVDLYTLEAEVHIPEQDYAKVRAGQEAILKIDAFPEKSFSGRVERKSPVIDSRSGTAEATIAVDNPEGILRPGMFVRVQIVIAVHPEALILPREAILMQGDTKTVFTVRDGVAREVTVQTGFQEGDRVEILDGLAGEDPVVVRGHLGLQGGTKVRVIEELDG
jgi:membrane fusion protein (multidrug efflux system)